MRILTLDADLSVREVPEALRIPVSWPCNAWKCSVPANLNPDLNILEKLILSLIHRNLVSSLHELHGLLSTEIGLDPALVTTAFEICERKGYFERGSTDQVMLSEEGIKKLEAYDQGDADASAEKKTVWLFVCAVNHAVIPRFDIDSLPDTVSFADDAVIRLPRPKNTENDYRRFPEALQLRFAIRTWKEILKQRNAEELTAIDPERESEEQISVKSLADRMKVKDEPWIPQRMTDDPETVNCLGYVCIDRYDTSRLTTVSPFGIAYDHYFDLWLERLRASNPELDGLLRKAVEECIQGASSYIAFDNSMKVALLDNVPQINNDPEFKELKNRIISMACFLQKTEEEQERSFYEFGMNFRASAELLFVYVFKKHPELEQTRDTVKLIPKDQRFEQMRAYLLQSGFSLRYNDAVLYNIVHGGPARRYTKDMLALMVIHSALQPQSVFSAYLSVTEIWLAELPDIITKIGNAAAHGMSIGDHLPAETYYQKIERLIKTTFEYLMDGGTSNGQI